MQIVEKKLSEIRPYEKNPRKNDMAVDAVANSIREFGFKVPVVIDGDGIIVAGHTRYKAAKKLGVDVVPCVVADDLSEDQIRAFRLADNKVGELAEWDIDLLNFELDNIDLDMSDFGFTFGDDEKSADNPYTAKIQIPQYEIQGEQPTLDELYDTEKADNLIAEIQLSNVSDLEKEFLIEAAKRHTAFNYKSIAEYYAHANEEMQELMERSALVIIDFDDAIANGYIKLSKSLERLREQNA